MANEIVTETGQARFTPKEVYSELLLGCGYDRKKRLKPEFAQERWQNLITCDINPRCNPDVEWDLNETPWPFQDNEFDEVHAYEVLEHLGRQGDYESFFAHFEEIWRILKPGGHLMASTPRWDQVWAWSDPGHTRIISEGTLTFLNQEAYEEASTRTCWMTDYREIYKGDLVTLGMQNKDDSLFFVLQARK